MCREGLTNEYFTTGATWRRTRRTGGQVKRESGLKRMLIMGSCIVHGVDRWSVNGRWMNGDENG